MELHPLRMAVAPMTESDDNKGESDCTEQLLINLFIVITFAIVCIICSELMGGRWACESDDEGFKRLRRAARLELD